MRTRFLLSGLATLLVTSAASAALFITHPFQDAPVQANDHHRRIQKGAGEWEGTIKMWMPGMEDGMESPCQESVRTVGEYWTVSDFSMEFMGVKFAGSSSMGYDTTKNKYVGTWIDSMTTSLTVMEGEWDADKKAIVMHYQMFEPMSGEMVDMRSEMKHLDGGVVESTFYQVTDEGDSRQMQIKMKRTVAEPVEAGDHR